MSKKRKRPKRATPLLQRIPEWGQIPWTTEELGAALDRAAQLHNTPHDDWNRRERGVTFQEPDGSQSRIVFNPDKMENQIMHWLHDQWRAQGLAPETVMAHSWRFFEVMGFLSAHSARLRAEGLVGEDPSDPDCVGLSHGLVQALAESPYEGVSLDRASGDPVPTFHPDRIIAVALRLDDADGDGAV